jgi:hypothetical protein
MVQDQNENKDQNIEKKIRIQFPFGMSLQKLAGYTFGIIVPFKELI